MRPEAVGDVSEDLVPVLELHPEQTVREGFDHPTPYESRWLGDER